MGRAALSNAHPNYSMARGGKSRQSGKPNAETLAILLDLLAYQQIGKHGYVQGQNKKALLSAAVSVQRGEGHYFFRGLVLKISIADSRNRLGLFRLSVYQGLQHIQELLLTRSRLSQDYYKPGADPSNLRLDDQRLAEFVQDIMVVQWIFLVPK